MLLLCASQREPFRGVCAVPSQDCEAFAVPGSNLLVSIDREACAALSQQPGRGESGRRKARPSGAACAQRGSIGQMQISAELLPIPDASGCVGMRRDASGCVGMRRDASGCAGIF